MRRDGLATGRLITLGNLTKAPIGIGLPSAPSEYAMHRQYVINCWGGHTNRMYMNSVAAKMEMLQTSASVGRVNGTKIMALATV
jgi:hypothetical protein